MAKFENVLGAVGIDATFAGALAVSKSDAAGSTILAMSPDTGERYVSTPSNRMVPKPAA